MSDGIVKKWVRAFKDGRNNVHNEKRTGHSSVISDDLMQKIAEKLKENRRFRISSLSQKFSHVPRSVQFVIVRKCLHYRKLLKIGTQHVTGDETLVVYAGIKTAINVMATFNVIKKVKFNQFQF